MLALIPLSPFGLGLASRPSASRFNQGEGV